MKTDTFPYEKSYSDYIIKTVFMISEKISMANENYRGFMHPVILSFVLEIDRVCRKNNILMH